jgi:hypothetical protein
MNAPVVTPSASPAIKPVAPPPFRLGSPSNVGPYLKMLVYGRPGIGKTELLASSADVPEMQDVLYLDAESGDATVRDNPRIDNWASLIDNRILCKTFKDVSLVHDWLVGHCRARDAYLKDKSDGAKKALAVNEARLRGVEPEEIKTPKLFRTVIVDSLSEINTYSNYELLGVSEAKVLSGDASEIEVATWDEFRKNNQRIQMLVRAFRNLPMHVLMAASEQYKQDEMKKFHYEPNLTGQLARQVQGAFDIVGYFAMQRQGEKNERRVYVQPVDRFDAKNRRSMFTGDFFSPDQLAMKSIMKLTGLTK